tara:strand:- start:32 stop:1828 length:1797 start_codon:yes stop_codon:yes gene_type:complete
MSKSRGLISGSTTVRSRTSGMYDNDDNVRLSNISTNGLDSLGFGRSILAENIASSAYDFEWSPDGLHLYIAESGDYIKHYTVTKPFTTTGKTQVESFNISTYDSSNYGFTMSPDGKYFYGSGPNRDGIFMFTSNVPYYLTNGGALITPSRTTFAYGYNQINHYLDNIFGIGSADGGIRGIEFNGDGTKMYLIGFSDDNIQQFSLSTPYEIGDAYDASAYDGAYNIGGDGITSPQGMRWNDDGSKFFVVDSSLDSVIEYSVSNAYDVTTGTITEGTNFSVNSYENNPYDVAFNADGTKMFVIGTSSDKIHEWTLSTGFDLSSTVTYVSGTSLGLTNPAAFDFSPDGTFMAVVDWYSDILKGYTLSTGFDSSTISATQTHDLTTIEGSSYGATTIKNHFTTPYGCRFNGDGTKITIMDGYSSSYDKAASMPLLIPYDVRGLADGYLNTIAQGMDNPWTIRFSRDGKKLYILDGSDSKIYQWALHTPYALGRGSSIVTFEGKSSSINGGDPSPRGFDWTHDGKGMFFMGASNDTIYFYTVSTPFDVTSTLTYKSSYDISYFEAYPYVIRVVNCHSRDDGGGYKLQLLGVDKDDIFEYDINF